MLDIYNIDHSLTGLDHPVVCKQLCQNLENKSKVQVAVYR